MCCNQPTPGSEKFNVSSKHVTYSFCNNSIPVAAVFAKEYKLFRDIISEHFADINVQIASLIRKINLERNILATNTADIPERTKSAIHKYVAQLEIEVETLIQVSNDLQKLHHNESLLKKLFKTIHTNTTSKKLIVK